jgi:hypothetical protein
MPAPTPDRPSPASQSAARRDRPFVLAVAALVVAAAALVLGVAMADRQPARPALAAAKAADARLGQYLYSPTVRDGSVRALVERQITPAC